MDSVNNATPVDFTLGKRFSLDDMPEVARTIQAGLRKNFPTKSDTEMTIAQILGVAEEAGEFVKAFRQYAGLARQQGSFDEVREELADVVIFAFTAAAYLGIDLPVAISAKAQKVLTRGYREAA